MTSSKGEKRAHPITFLREKEGNSCKIGPGRRLPFSYPPPPPVWHWPTNEGGGGVCPIAKKHLGMGFDAFLKVLKQLT